MLSADHLDAIGSVVKAPLAWSRALPSHAAALAELETAGMVARWDVRPLSAREARDPRWLEVVGPLYLTPGVYWTLTPLGAARARAVVREHGKHGRPIWVAVSAGCEPWQVAPEQVTIRKPAHEAPLLWPEAVVDTADGPLAVACYPDGEPLKLFGLAIPIDRRLGGKRPRRVG